MVFLTYIFLSGREKDRQEEKEREGGGASENERNSMREKNKKDLMEYSSDVGGSPSNQCGSGSTKFDECRSGSGSSLDPGQ